jgi:aryl-alcohol dehydrogenase-like predicted oxidoreductase
MPTRRQLLQLSAALLALRSMSASTDDTATAAPIDDVIRRAIPGSGELLPVIGMGTSGTFERPADPDTLAQLTALLQAFFQGKGYVIDSSPMYGEAEARVGDILRAMPDPAPVFTATKVWTHGKEAGIAQMEASARRMNVAQLDLIAVHNLKDWQTQLETLKAWKAEGKVRYIGITTSHGRYHQDLLELMRTQPLDFVQFSYNIEDRSAEEELLPLAQDRGIATMINRPYQRGSLFSHSKGEELPALATELGCSSWGQFYLKFILAHPGVTTIIPATSKLEHMVDNMMANSGPVPDELQRQEMLRVFANL